MNKPHKKLRVWQLAMKLCVIIYNITDKFPKNEMYGLAAELRKAAVSIPSNIAEGAARSNAKESIHFFNIARSSLSELDTQFEISITLNYVDANTSKQTDLLMIELDKSLFGLWKRCKETLK